MNEWTNKRTVLNIGHDLGQAHIKIIEMLRVVTEWLFEIDIRF